MRKQILISLIFLCLGGLFLTGCTTERLYATPDGAVGHFGGVEPHIEKYFHGRVVFNNGEITSGQSVWDAFVNAAYNNEPSTVILENNWTLNAAGLSPELYAEIKDDYPMQIVQTLDFSGDRYGFTLSWAEGDTGIFSGFRYLMRFEEPAPSATATYTSKVMYILVNDSEVTWQQLFHGMVSSYSGAFIDHKTVYIRRY